MPESAPNELVVCHLGRAEYGPTRRLQQAVQERLIAAKRSSPPEPMPHVLLLLEHPPVYTLGKSADDENLLVAEERLAALGAEVHHVGRGGDVTFHGPGQLVGYPMIDLDRLFTDLGRYMRTLEEVIIRACAEYEVAGGRVDGRTGVWVGPDDRGPERKICAMGVRCSRWVTMHGFALNVATDLSYFDHIVPCGIADRGVTSLVAETATDASVEALREPVVRHFAEQFDVLVSERTGPDAWSFLEAYTGALAEAA